MRVCIHRGAKEIGGTCVEIEWQGKRLVLDVGLPLDAETFPLHPVKGFDVPDESLPLRAQSWGDLLPRPRKPSGRRQGSS